MPSSLSRRTVLLIGLCALTVAAVSAASDPDAIEAEFHRRADLAEAGLAEMKALREAFPGPDPEGAIRRWRSLEKAHNDFEVWHQRERTDYHRATRSSVFVGLAGGLFKAKTGRGRDVDREAQSARWVGGRDRMKGRVLRLAAAMKEESETFHPMAGTYLREKARTRRVLAWAACAALALSLAGFAYSRIGIPDPPDAAPALPPPTTPFPPAVAGNFTIVRVLGRGSMGEVYEALDLTLNRRTALKRLRAELLENPAELERLLTEARVMAALKHPNMVAIYGVERDAGQVYLALEYVDGGTLAVRLASERRLPWAEALRVLESAAAAVDYCHGHKVIHRDIKPANIMLSSSGEVKVTDFSIAYRAAQSVSRLTRQPSWGTPPYMSPEQELGELSASADVFALGVCFYEMLTGELPFIGPNFLAQKREAAYAPPRRLVADLPRGADELFALALAAEPTKRFRTAGALAAAARALSA